MIYCFDLDGTLCTNQRTDYRTSQPWPDRIAIVNALYGEGHTIKIFTARGATTGIDWQELTEQQLKEWGVHYHKLIMGKPHADFYVDDKSMRPEEIFDISG